MARGADTENVEGTEGAEDEDVESVESVESVEDTGAMEDGDGMDVFVGRLDPEMCVVTAAAGGERAGCLVGFSSQCSIHPVRFVVWLSEANRTFRVARDADVLAVHLLAREQRGLAELFGGQTGDRVDKFAHVRWRQGYGGAAVLEEARAWFVGRILHRVDGGDHVGFVLDPVEWGGAREPRRAAGRGAGEEPPLRLGDAAAIQPGHPAD
ncbi:Oxidoreductase [Streptomyces leeuwenhoekii]|uniref:Oxidoreductase n=2 Tax=Streptomyces leeuwenhoekii TaxID=1437453 RepID=A0A0F7VR52_STRLW|nr:Oxidoreductase [Streptomyces leeuwenhoekii]